jgi:peptidoglycan hydrolase CwlO-like protein
MSEQQPGQGLFTIAEAAAIWGISRQAVYKRLSTLDNQGFIGLHGGKRYITRQGIEAFKEVDNQVDNLEGESVNQHDNQAEQVDNQVDRLTTQVDTLKEQLQAAESRALSLQATVDAQQAHIDSLKQALDREQALHMASLQARLPAGRGRFMDWIRGRRGED